MKVTVNGESVDVPVAVTLQELLDACLDSTRGVAAAVDGAVAPRSTWADVVLHAGQQIELVTAVQGG